jgi:1-acyl-sn-glycerol-3-phosphate acyltransferase
MVISPTVEKLLYFGMKPILDAFTAFRMRMDIAFEAPLPEGPIIIAPNHPSVTDPFLVSWMTGVKSHILIADEVFKIPVFGRYLRASGHIPVVPGSGRAAFDEALAKLENGEPVMIFPEGEISPLEGGFARPHTGAARLALLTGAPVVPMGIHLLRERIRVIRSAIDGQPVDQLWYLDGPYNMTVGEALRFTGSAEDRDLVRQATDRIMRDIMRLAYQSALRLQQQLQPAFYAVGGD